MTYSARLGAHRASDGFPGSEAFRSFGQRLLCEEGLWPCLHPGVELRANIKSISHRCHLFEMEFVWELTHETIHLLLGCLQCGSRGCRSFLRALPQSELPTILKLTSGVDDTHPSTLERKRARSRQVGETESNAETVMIYKLSSMKFTTQNDLY